MSEYKRLTKQVFDKVQGCEDKMTMHGKSLFDLYNRLAELEDKIENGTIIELPCKVGDIVYKKDGAWTVVGFDCNLVNSWKVKLERWKNKYLDEHETTKVVFSSFGKTVFFTEEEARLKELQEKHK